ncbi:Acyl-CoA synthetase [Ignavibacterium album JCM 16511]|uniref:Acyl-CoA synthetase n=1 Tax=Ignavibacterium album (strain DSM 19864 / JCM 16511 / NBRC 101810 / Mat9-16) TaxID=945713 RepID=I0AK70_IGNAJ|nr:acetoacetate--CoA ligase [Ignavibacterium album]AFH49377.1 Acyl-CoA synthetase [Ignavibacterium album JCM 16511]
MSELLWSPSKERISNSNITKFISFISEKERLNFSDYHQLYDWSVNNIEKFWEYIWEFSGIKYKKKFDKVLIDKGIKASKWFVGSEINFAENLLRFDDDKMALISYRENYPPVKITYAQLNSIVKKVTNALREFGIEKGYRVAGYVANVPEAVIAMLATTSIGAIWSSTSPDFGIEGVVDRFGQIEPKILFATKSYFYGGKHIDNIEKILEVKKRIPSIQKVILIDEYFDFNSVSNARSIENDILDFSELLNHSEKDFEFAYNEFDHPVYIMYSSGTTGKPKCIVHGAGGTLLQHYKELALHTDLQRDDTITYFTTCGWMMWNWLVSSLQIGATVVLIDGNPAYPNERLWKIIEDEKITIFGTSPKYLTLIEKSGLVPNDKFNLNSLKTILSTGSPLTDSNFHWVYKNVKDDVLLSSISGGTDIISCFMLGCPILPVHAGEIQCRGLAMKVEAWDESGNSLIEEKGELVCAAPFPSRPVYFWNDEDGAKYHNAYFNYYPGVWRHGDYIKITSNGGVIVYGRSDSTLNPGGVRIGTAEIYKIVESMNEIADSLVVGKNTNGDVEVILFVVTRNNKILDEELIHKIKNEIRKATTPRHVPSRIIQIKEVPYTISGKKVEIAVTKILNGEKVDNREALANPKSLEQFYNLNI